MYVNSLIQINQCQKTSDDAKQTWNYFHGPSARHCCQKGNHNTSRRTTIRTGAMNFNCKTGNVTVQFGPGSKSILNLYALSCSQVLWHNSLSWNLEQFPHYKIRAAFATCIFAGDRTPSKSNARIFCRCFTQIKQRQFQINFVFLGRFWPQNVWVLNLQVLSADATLADASFFFFFFFRRCC